MCDKSLKEKAFEAAKKLEFIFEDTRITKIKPEGNRILFYSGDEILFDFSKDDVMKNNY